MRAAQVNKVIIAAMGAAALISLCLWIRADSALVLTRRVPGMDGQDPALHGANDRGSLDGVLSMSEGVPSDLPGHWPCFRGSNLDNISTERFTPAGKGQGFPCCWSIDVGEGHAGAAVHSGRVYVLDYDRENEADALRCLSLDDGHEIWRYSYHVKIKRNHGMSRTVPAVNSEFVVALGPKCHVTCLDSLSGELIWAIDLVREFGATVPPWYAGQCPIIDGGRVILAPGGSALMIAVDCGTGEIAWQAPNNSGWKMTHSSILPMEFSNRRFYVYCGSRGVAGVSAEDGSILWKTDEWRIRMATVPTPVDVGKGRIFLCGGYGSGSMMLQLEEKQGRIEPRILFRLGPERFGSAQHTPIFYQDHIYGVRPDGQLVCLDLDGNEKWSSSSAYKFGLGPYIMAGSMIYVMNDSCLLSRVEADPQAFDLVDRTSVLKGHDSWGPMAFAGGRLIVRDLTRMSCLDMTGKR